MMSLSKTLATLVSSCTILVTLALLIVVSHAQNDAADYLDVHNVARAAVGVPDVVWDDVTLAAYAQAYAELRIGDCANISSPAAGVTYGELIGVGYDTGKDAVEAWLADQIYYHYDTNTCDAGQDCGFYTQVVWRDTLSIGCARVQCADTSFFVVCEYYPPAVRGERPY